MTKKASKQIDAQIDRIFSTNCSGVQINIMDIGKVFTAGHAAHAAGQDMTAAILATVASIRKN